MGRMTTFGGAIIAVGLLCTSAQAADPLCDSWKRVIDAASKDFASLRGEVTKESRFGTTWKSTADLFDTKDCVIVEERFGKGLALQRVRHTCQLKMSAPTTNRWERVVFNYTHCAKQWGDVVEQLPPRPVTKRCGDKACHFMRVSHGAGRPADVGRVHTRFEMRADQYKIERLRLTVEVNHRPPHERTWQAQPRLTWKRPTGKPKKGKLKKRLVGKRGQGDCFLLALGRERDDPAVVAMTEAIGGAMEVTTDDGGKHLVFAAHGVNFSFDKAGKKIVSVRFKARPGEGPKVKPYRGRLPFGLSARDGYQQVRDNLGQWRDYPSASVYLTDRTIVKIDYQDRKVGLVFVLLRKAWTPYPLTRSCGF